MDLLVILFGVTALGGAFLGTLRMRKTAFPVFISFGHGALAALCVTLLLLQVINYEVNIFIKLSALLFLCAAMGGLFAVSFHLRGKDLPRGILFSHAGLAIVAFLFLITGHYFI